MTPRNMMKSGKRFALALVTAPDLKTGRRLAQAVLTARLAACVNLIPEIESHYWWQGKIESGREVLLVLKTTTQRLKALEKLIVAEHPYDTPEFIIVSLEGGSRRYLDWVAQSAASMPAKGHKRP
jgi:periplasmic divalent cation tolerance protein